MSFVSSIQHLLAELERIDLLIQMQVWQAKQSLTGDRTFSGLVLNDEDINRLLAQPVGAPRWIQPGEVWASVYPQLNQVTQTLEQRTQQAVNNGVFLRLITLAQLFELPRIALDILLVCLAPEVDTRYGRLYGYLQDDVSRQHPTVDLILSLLCPDFASKLVARSWFDEISHLLHYGLLRLGDPTTVLLNRTVTIDPRIVNYLLEQDATLEGTEFVQPHITLDALVLTEDLRRQIHTFAQPTQPGLLLYLQGDYGSGRRTLAEVLCFAWGRRLLLVDTPKLLHSVDFKRSVRLMLREAMLTGAVLCWQRIDPLLAETHADLLDTFLQQIGTYDETMIVCGESPWLPRKTQHRFIQLAIPRPDFVQRLELWERLLPNTALPLAEIANTFRFTPGQIRDAIATAQGLALHQPQIQHEHLLQACRMQSNRRLSTLAQPLNPRYAWNDIVLPEAQKRILWEIYNQMRHRWRVYQEWGFDRKLSLGKGLNVLFAGPSGTGKTMAAEIIAGALGQDLYKIDLSTVISKYIGDTEKHLAQIFNEAQSSNAILFFDEADAVFGKRSEVSDAHDRFANIQVSFLLQRMEEYDGVVVLTTNLRKNMDEAFVRRMHFIVEFPLPDEAYRLQIWQHIFPANVPLCDDVDWLHLARQFELTGGSIRNIAVAAAFFAADEDQQLSMRHLLQAVQREYQKMGKVVR